MCSKRENHLVSAVMLRGLLATSPCLRPAWMDGFFVQSGPFGGQYKQMKGVRK